MHKQKHRGDERAVHKDVVTLGIIAAMHEELQHILGCTASHKKNRKKSPHTDPDKGFYKLDIPIEYGGAHHLVVAESGWGKVAAATAATILIERYKVNKILMVGFCGGISKELKKGQAVTPWGFIQYDYSAEPFLPRAVLQDLRFDVIRPDKTMLYHLERVGAKCIHLMGTADQFVYTRDQRKGIESFKGIEAIDMESAAVAHSCHLLKIPFACVKIVSDSANHESSKDFPRFVQVHTPEFLKYIEAVL